MKKGLLGLSLLGVCMTANAQISFDQYVEEIKGEARLKGYNEQIVEQAFDDVKLYQSAIKADKNQPERRLTLDEYLARALPAWKVKQANQLYQKHKHVLEPIAEYYGVSPKIIVALWGVETNFGKFTGNYNVISALTTMAYEGRREAFFKSQLMDALTILEQGHIQASDMKGSWAGAMGQSQFMPSSYLAYAADGDNDGVADIWNNKADVFASAANYLSSVGWQAGYRWGRPVTLTQRIADTMIGFKEEQGQVLADWSRLGILKLNGAALPDADIKAWLIEPEPGRYFLVYRNYLSLLDWNRSHHFVFSVVGLADKIR